MSMPRSLMLLLMLSTVCLHESLARADGNQLLEQCTGAERILDRPETFKGDYGRVFLNIGMCTGLVQGTRQTMSILNSSVPTHLKACVPDGANNSQAIRIVLQYLRANPQFLHYPEVSLIFRALQEAYPCR